MSRNYLSFVVTHGRLGCAMKAVSEKLIIPATELLCFSNQELTLEEIESKIQAKIAESRPEKILFFVDLVGGSCWLLSNRIKRDNKDITVIGGVNVPMIISYFINYERLEWTELIDKIVNDATKGIVSR